MSDTDKPIIDHLREQFALLDARFDQLDALLAEPPRRPVTLEFIAEQNVRILAEIRAIHDDISYIMLRRMDAKLDRAINAGRLDRIERRLDQIEGAR